MADWQIESLNDAHDRGEFRCGKAPLDAFLREYAGQYERKGIGRTWVATRPGAARVYGYYTLAAGATAVVDLPPKLAKKLPKHPVPVVLLGRLAVDESVRGQRLGELLLLDALRRCLTVADHAAAYAVEVFAIDLEAKRFYEKYGFTPFLDQDQHLFLPIPTIRRGFAGK